MTFVIEIHDYDEDRTLPNESLTNIINCLPCVRDNRMDLFYWKIVELECFHTHKNSEQIYSLQNKVYESNTPIKIDYQFLIDLPQSVSQIINLFLIVNQTDDELSSHESDKNCYDLYDYTIEILDGGILVVSSRDMDFLENLKNTFKDIRNDPRTDIQATIKV